MNLPNKLTMARIVMIFIFLVICNVDERLPANWQMPWKIVGVLFAFLAGLTDILDGYIARKYNLITDFGQLMDPLADKIFMATTFIMLVDKGILEGWVAVIVLSREFLVTGLRLLGAGKGVVIPADITGKLKTSLQMAFVVIGGYFWILGWKGPEIKNTIWVWWCWEIAKWVIIAVTVYSGANYFYRLRHLYLDKKL
ncbi:MAG TPA: CDP-diacylglycerol--glycerol-3-phosphate 3-phosphatidyltransferase [Lentisphaeria bacterium]|nr:MAG: CDP-diacylglycerol--glycerol-3-phosphate 3-phosphatidyltransferase [Lentisphaerae bacterium GWF2_49_21]HBC85479.1 CDP-diacylglycerol--glycerol-3-phosphate 3-phosphatidyltransferase [Lentisphaeria bacterium]